MCISCARFRFMSNTKVVICLQNTHTIHTQIICRWIWGVFCEFKEVWSLLNVVVMLMYDHDLLSSWCLAALSLYEDCSGSFKSIIFNRIIHDSSLATHCEIAFNRMHQNLTNGKSILVRKWRGAIRQQTINWANVAQIYVVVLNSDIWDMLCVRMWCVVGWSPVSICIVLT